MSHILQMVVTMSQDTTQGILPLTWAEDLKVSQADTHRRAHIDQVKLRDIVIHYAHFEHGLFLSYYVYVCKSCT